MQNPKKMTALKSFFASLFFIAGVSASFAQSSPNLTFGEVLTPAQWNQLFINKNDTLGYTPLNSAGGVLTGRLVTAAPSSTTAGLNLTPGTPPGSPVNGDLWTTSAGIFAQINGTTINLTGAASTSFAGTSPITVSFPSGVVTYACATCGVTGSPLSQFAATTSAQLAGVLSDETGSGLLVFGTSPTLVTPVIASIVNTGTLTLPTVTDTLVARTTTDTLTNKTLTSPTINAGAISGTFSGAATFSGALTLSSALTYGGVTLSNSVTGTGSMVLSAAPTLTGAVMINLGSDAAGDIYYRSAGGLLTRLPIGGNGNILNVASGLPAWTAPTGGGNVSNTGTPVANQVAQWTNATTIQGANVASLLTAGSGIAITGTTNATITCGTATGSVIGCQKQGTSFSSTLPNSTQVGSGSGTVMVGNGGTCAFTPRSTGVMSIHIYGEQLNSGSLGTTSVSLRYGTGAAPGINSTTAGTQLGQLITQTSTAASQNSFFSVGGTVTLSVGTAYWFDDTQAANANNVQLFQQNCEAVEIN